MWELDYKESWVTKNDAFELGWWKSVLNMLWKDWCWSWNSNNLATWCKELTHLKRPWCWERLMAGGEGDDRGWDGWVASPTQWTWVWASSRCWQWTGKPGMLQSMGSQRVGHYWVIEINWNIFNLWNVYTLKPSPWISFNTQHLQNYSISIRKYHTYQHSSSLYV